MVASFVFGVLLLCVMLCVRVEGGFLFESFYVESADFLCTCYTCSVV